MTKRFDAMEGQSLILCKPQNLHKMRDCPAESLEKCDLISLL